MSEDNYLEKICDACKTQFKPHNSNENYCWSCNDLYCRKCNTISCEYIILGGENDPETAKHCKTCKSIYHFDDNEDD